MSQTQIDDEARRATVRRTGDRMEEILLGALGIFLLVAGWEAAARAGWLNPVIVSSPSAIAQAFGRQWASGELLEDLKISSFEFAVGFGMSLVVGITLGILMGLNRWVEYVVDPLDRKSTRLNSSHVSESRMPSSA